MIDTLDALCREVERSIPPLAAVKIRCVEPERRAKLLELGFPGMLPLWREAGLTIGLLAAPGISFRGWIGVVEKDGSALTLSADSRTLLPRHLMTRFLSNDVESAEHLTERLPVVGPALAALHAVLGGAPESLAAVLDVIGEPERRAEFGYDPSDPARFEHAHSVLARAIDPSEAFARYADWIDATLADAEGDGVRPPDADHGPWTRQIFARAFRLPSSSADDVVPPAAVAVDLLEAFAGLDTGVPQSAGWELRPGEASDEALLSRLARAVRDKDLPRDGVARGLCKALRKGGMGYLGLAHAEAVAKLDERGEPERAWAALHSAAWWTARNAPEANPPMLDAVRLLCERHGWDDLRRVIDRNAP